MYTFRTFGFFSSISRHGLSLMCRCNTAQLKNFDSQLRFGELPEGSYTYMVVLTDSNGQTLCFMSDFTVSGSASSTAMGLTVW